MKTVDADNDLRNCFKCLQKFEWNWVIEQIAVIWLDGLGRELDIPASQRVGLTVYDFKLPRICIESHKSQVESPAVSSSPISLRVICLKLVVKPFTLLRYGSVDPSQMPVYLDIIRIRYPSIRVHALHLEAPSHRRRGPLHHLRQLHLDACSCASLRHKYA